MESSCCEPAYLESAVDFPARIRPHVAINVVEIRPAYRFYTALFGEPPVKVRDDYLKWEPASPPLNFTANKHPEELMSREWLGIEVDRIEQMQAIAARLRKIGADINASDVGFSVMDGCGNRWQISLRSECTANKGGAT